MIPNPLTQLFASLLAAALLAEPIRPTADSETMDEPIVVGRRITLYSEALGEERQLFIGLPAGYEGSREAYPVLYVLDGEAHFLHVLGIARFLAMQGGIPQVDHVPPMIVVGIPNTDRTRDLAPAVVRDGDSGDYAAAGASAAFLAFLRDELVPHIDERYRTRPHRTLVGHCLAGAFSLHAFLAEPELFDATIAITPYTFLESYAPGEHLGPVLREQPERMGFLYLVIGDEEPRWVRAVEDLAGTLRESAPEGLSWHYQRLTDTGHGAEVHKAVYEGLERLYSGWRLPEARMSEGLAAVEAHYRALSERFGYAIHPPENLLNRMGYALLGQRRHDQAIEVLERAVDLYPWSWNAHDSLGEGYLAAGERELALASYERSLEINPRNANGAAVLERLRDGEEQGSR